MGKAIIREPVQKRSIEKKEKIIRSGFDLICEKGYHNINTSQIAKKANVSTGIVYQYFNDKHDIFIAGLEKYSDSIFYPMIDLSTIKFEKKELPKIFKKIIKKYISNHKLSQTAHEEITSMIHSDKEIAYYFYKQEIDMTHSISNMLKVNGYNLNNLNERVHIIIGLIDNLCHEVVYHKHKEINYSQMEDLVIVCIVNILS